MSGVRRSLSAKTGFVGAMSGMGGARDRDIVIFLPHLDAPRRKAARGPRRDPPRAWRRFPVRCQRRYDPGLIPRGE